MNGLDEQLKALFRASRPARGARLHTTSQAPYGFANRVVANGFKQPDAIAVGWAQLSGWGLGLACGLMLISFAFYPHVLVTEWSPALAAAQEVSELVSLP